MKTLDGSVGLPMQDRMTGPSGAGRFASACARSATCALIVSLMFVAPARAVNCTLASGWSFRNIVISATGRVPVPRDLPNGTVLYTISGPAYGNNTDFADCPTVGTQYAETLSQPHGLDVASKVFPTGVTGVGLKIATSTGYNFYPITAPYDSNPPGGRPIHMHWNGPPIVEYRFIKTGLIVDGTVSDTDLPKVRYSLDHTLNIFETSPTGVNLSFVSLACTTPNVTVDMGQANKTDFIGIGTRDGARPFEIELRDCPAGLNAIQFALAATGNVVDASQGVIALSPESTASGVGIQVKRGGSPVRYDGTAYAYPEYTGADTYRIQFEAAYYQTQSAVTAGSANGELEFTMSYL